MNAGQIHECDTPYTLLQNPESMFFKMVQQTGKAEASYLLQTAKQVCLSDNTQRSFYRHVHLTQVILQVIPGLCRKFTLLTHCIVTINVYIKVKQYEQNFEQLYAFELSICWQYLFLIRYKK